MAETKINTGHIAIQQAGSPVSSRRMAINFVSGATVTDNAGNNSTDITISGGGGTAASQADMEAATSTTTFVSPGRTQYHPGVAKAWVSFNLATNGILASYGVSSITDGAVGTATINWTTAFSTANYCGVSQNAQYELGNVKLVTKTTTSVVVQNFDNGAVLVDTAEVNVVVYGDQ